MWNIRYLYFRELHMDSSSLKKQYICNSSINQSTPSIMVSKCPCHCFGIIPGPHDFISMNSIELNNGASISDDSGVPLTTNSSISSCDSFRIGMCKYEMEMAESDGEASQFDSLENCSESGMSAENFNTLKKGPVVPIDPPPEFQDSPQITPIPSLSDSISKKIRRWSLSQSTFEYTKEGSGNLLHNTKIDKNNLIKNANKSIGELYSVNKHLYSSDSILNILNDNIYDEPNNIISTSMGTSIDIIDSDCSSIPIPLVSTPKNCNRPIHPSNQEYSRYFKAIPSDQDNLVTAAQMVKQEKLSVIHQYGLYYGTTKNFTYQYDNNLQRKVLQSPLKHIYQYNRHHNHTGISSSGNRPHSRNSFNGRLSSSHNSLGVSKSNKADDSIFITQAMSHDALLTCDISDFYNVPIDSDIYAFPIDMIKPDIENKKITDFAKKAKEIRIIVQSDDVSTDRYYKSPNQKSLNKNNRIKRRKRLKNDFCDMNTTFKDQNEVLPANTYKTFKENLNNEGKPHEPLHMSLQEVKHFYHSFYADLHEDTNNRSEYIPKLRTLSSNKTIWNSKPNCKTKLNKENTIKRSLEIKVNAAKNNKLDSHNENINNNNNNTTVVNHNNYQHKYPKISNIIGHHLQHHQTSKLSKFSATNNKLILQTDKKSQFALNFKQKFCSIFRFGKNNRCRENSTGPSEYITNTMHTSNQALTTEDKGNKFQSRALPPLPKKADTKDELSCGRADRNTEFKSYHFTSSIEKVKDYGWYWGPLSSEAAEKVLSNEPDGSFIVRDSSDHHYIFSLSFKLNSCVRHVRIEQDQGTFSFGSYAKFKSQTITEFIEKAVEHSRSGRYLFFLHRRPEHGPLRVQLTNPVSRFKHVQSLQHMCRFIIVKAVIRKDLIQTLPLPRRLLDYLNYKHCYSEQVESDNSQISGDASTT